MLTIQSWKKGAWLTLAISANLFCTWKLFLENNGQWLLSLVKSFHLLSGEKGSEYTKIVSLIMERAY